MEMDPGKLFVGGISWDTNEDHLKEYFQTFGEVVEAVIMKDRTTGRARGFGFVVFVDPVVAERVVKQKHIIDGRTVEAKKAVPRDDQQNLNRSNSIVQGSPGPIRTKKIFVGGLASTVTESDFKSYFDQFGKTIDVVVMYDHNTQRPRGFGFITYESEESVEKVLLRTFHELNGKRVEVKRAVPKESSPGPNRSNISGYNGYGLSRVSNYFNRCDQGYNSSSLGGYGLKVDGRFSPITISRTSYSPFGPSSYNIGNLGSNLGYGSAPNRMHGLTPNRFAGPIGYGGADGNASVFNSTNHEMWGNGNLSYNSNSSPNSSNFLDQGNGLGRGIWGDCNSDEGGGVNVIGYGRKGGGKRVEDGGGSIYTNSTWRSPSPDLEVPGLFSFGFRSGASESIEDKSVGYVTGIAAAN